MTTSEINSIIFRAFLNHGSVRASAGTYRQIDIGALVRATGLDRGVVESACDALCRPSQFQDHGSLVRVGDTYAQRIVVSYDDHMVKECDDGRFAVHYDRNTVNSIHDTLDAAGKRADELDHERYVSQVRRGRAVDATYHDCGRNRAGEAVYYPD